MSKLPKSEIASFLNRCPDEFCVLVLALRRFVLKIAPGAVEAIKFNTLCYFKPDVPFGSIGGNICLIEAHEACVQFSFIHGAFLPDPMGLLKGKARAKRYVEIRTMDDFRQPAVENLLKAALAYTPHQKK